MVTEIWINIGSDNGLLPDGTKPLPEPIGWFLIYDFLWHSPESNFTANTHATYTILYNECGMHACTSKITANELKSIEHVEPICFHWMMSSWGTPMDYFIMEVNLSLAKLPLNFSDGLGIG